MTCPSAKSKDGEERKDRRDSREIFADNVIIVDDSVGLAKVAMRVRDTDGQTRSAPEVDLADRAMTSE